VKSIALIVIGGSAGSLQALNTILPALTAGPESPPVLVALHLHRNTPTSLAQLFAATCATQVREAEDKETMLHGAVYFAPPDYHLLVNKGEWLSLSIDPPVNFCRPSIDILFESASVAFGPQVLGVILSGANDDGAAGLAAIAAAGGTAVVQDPECAASARMPSAALKKCANARSLKVDEIATLLRNCRVGPESS
jgi:two-component system chemotaxis response regulator CheB